MINHNKRLVISKLVLMFLVIVFAIANAAVDTKAISVLGDTSGMSNLSGAKAATFAICAAFAFFIIGVKFDARDNHERVNIAIHVTGFALAILSGWFWLESEGIDRLLYISTVLVLAVMTLAVLSLYASPILVRYLIGRLRR